MGVRGPTRAHRARKPRILWPQWPKPLNSRLVVLGDMYKHDGYLVGGYILRPQLATASQLLCRAGPHMYAVQAGVRTRGLRGAGITPWPWPGRSRRLGPPLGLGGTCTSRGGPPISSGTSRALAGHTSALALRFPCTGVSRTAAPCTSQKDPDATRECPSKPPTAHPRPHSASWGRALL